MDNKFFIDLILNGSEERNLEYKQSMSWKDKSTKAKVVRTSLSMVNIRDGGVMIFGVEQTSNGKFKPSGMEAKHVDTFSQDEVQEYINEFADPYVDLTVTNFKYDNKCFVIIQIKEFDEIPVVCKKCGVDVNKGQIFTRPRRKIESVPVSSQTEMREILEMALDKNIRKIRESLSNWCFIGEVLTPSKIDEDEFKRQLGDL